MFVKLTENLKKTRPLSREYRGVVIDNQDPKGLRRVKVSIPGFLEGSKDELPWASPSEDTSGGNPNTGWFSVPEIGDYLRICFPTEDVYFMEYRGWWADENSKIPEFANNSDYPDIVGYKNNQVTLLINKAKDTLDFEHKTGFKISIDADGNYNLTVPETFTQQVAEHIINSSGLVQVNADGDFEAISQSLAALRGPTVELGESPSYHATISENVVAAHDSHQHLAPQAPAGTLPTLTPLVPMSTKAGTALDVKALKIFIQGNI